MSIWCCVKTKARFYGEPATILKQLVSNSEIPVVFGCTDLRVAFEPDDDLPEGVLVDSLESLANSIVQLHSA